MVRISRFQRSALAAAAFAALGVVSLPAFAEKPHTNWGPVGPGEPILATVGGKRMVAFYEPDGDTCIVTAVMFDAADTGGGPEASRVVIALHPGEIFNVDAVAGHRIALTCAPNAGMLTVLNRGELPTRAARAE
jgi:hypothetical protein